MRVMIHILLLIGIMSGASVIADAPHQNKTQRYDVKWQQAAPMFGAAVVLAAMGWYLRTETKPFTTNELSALSSANINSFDRAVVDNWSPSADKASDLLRNVLLIVPAALMLFENNGNDWLSTGVMYLEALSLASGSALFIKGVMRRPRPYTYNPEVPDLIKQTVDARSSFVSGHATVAFASAVFLATTFMEFYFDSPMRYWVWGISLLAAATVSGLRVAAGQHFYSDVIAGGVLGAAVGYAVPRWHRKPTQQAAGLSLTISLH